MPIQEAVHEIDQKFAARSLEQFIQNFWVYSGPVFGVDKEESKAILRAMLQDIVDFLGKVPMNRTCADVLG